MLFNITVKDLKIILKSQAIKHMDDRKTEIPANYSEEQPALESEAGWWVSWSHPHQTSFIQLNIRLHLSE